MCSSHLTPSKGSHMPDERTTSASPSVAYKQKRPRLSRGRGRNLLDLFGRDGEIRTRDPLNPIQGNHHFQPVSPRCNIFNNSFIHIYLQHILVAYRSV
jgi:hypothetical protein